MIDKDEMKNRISMALKDPVLQQGFEIICKENAELKRDKEDKVMEDVKQIEEMKMCCNCEYWYMEAMSIRCDNIPCYQHGCNCKGCVHWKLWERR